MNAYFEPARLLVFRSRVPGRLKRSVVLSQANSLPDWLLYAFGREMFLKQMQNYIQRDNIWFSGVFLLCLHLRLILVWEVYKFSLYSFLFIV